MKKLKKFVVLCLAVIMLFTACGKKGEEVTKELSRCRQSVSWQHSNVIIIMWQS